MDIEEDAPADVDFDALARRVLSPQESADYHSLAEGDARATAFLTYWVRKEAVLKATGDGLRLPMTSITVSPADEPPRLLSAPMLRKPSLTTLHNLRGPGNLAGRPAPQARVLAHVADSPSPKDISVIEADAEELLGLCPV